MTFFSAVIGFDYTGKQIDAKSATLHVGVLVLKQQYGVLFQN